MGKKKSVMKLTEDLSARNITYCKRKRGLIKKAMEMSILCGQQVFLVIYDLDKSKLVNYQSCTDLNVSKVMDLCTNPSYLNDKFEYYTDSDYDKLKKNH